MKNIQLERAIFGDFYYNGSAEEIKEYALLLKKYSLDEIKELFKSRMQDILAHLLGCNSFLDSIMCKRQSGNYTLANHAIGKRKLTEFFSLLEALGENELYLDIDKIKFSPNELDTILAKEKQSPQSYLQKYLSYLSFDSLDSFFEQVIRILEVKPMTIESNAIDSMIPLPSSFNFKHNYYECIDSLKYIGDKKDKATVREKHPQAGEVIDARNWIRSYQQRFKIENAMKDSSYSQDIDFSEQYNSEEFSEEEREKLRRTAQNKKEEIQNFKLTLINLRPLITQVLTERGVSATEDELDSMENDYILDKVIQDANLSKKPTKTNSLKGLLYATILATILTTSDINFLPTKENNIAQVEYENPKIPNRIKEEYLKEDNIPSEDEIEKTQLSNKNDSEEQIFSPDESVITEAKKTEKEFKIGEVVEIIDGILKYDSSISNEPLGVMTTPGRIIGYFAVVFDGEENRLIKSCRSQQEIDEFLQNYNGEMGEIHWRCAVNTQDNPELDRLIELNAEIPHQYTTFYIDYDQPKVNTLKGGK